MGRQTLRDPKVKELWKEIMYGATVFLHPAVEQEHLIVDTE